MNRTFRREELLPVQEGAADIDPFALVKPASVFVRLLFAIFFVFDFPAFTVQLSFNAFTGQWTGSPVIALATLLGEIFALFVIFGARERRQLVWQCWPILAFIALAFISTAWSMDRKATIDTSVRVAGTLLLGLAIVGRMPYFAAIVFVVRTMVLGCVLSIVWVFLYPDTSMHQATDLVQSVHAGLWRGIFSHKQGLGYFAGFTTGLLLYYRTMIFNPVVLICAIGCSLTCLVGTQSATGIVTTVIVPAFLYVAQTILRSPLRSRKGAVLRFAALFCAVGLAFRFGVLDFVITGILGKSTDLTGRADFWPIALANFDNSGASLLGGGFGSDLASNLSEWSIDNGYIDMLIVFGYLTVPIFFGALATLLWKSIQLLLTASDEFAPERVFPFALLCAILVANITESNFMTKCWGTVLTAVAAALIFQLRNRDAMEERASAQAAIGQASAGA